MNQNSQKKLDYLLNSYRKKLAFQRIAHVTYWVLLALYITLSVIWFLHHEYLNRDLEEIAVLGALIALISGILILFDIHSKKKTLQILDQEKKIETEESKAKLNQVFNEFKSSLSLRRRFMPVLILVILNMLVLYILSVRVYSSHLILFIYIFSSYIIFGGFFINKNQKKLEEYYSTNPAILPSSNSSKTVNKQETHEVGKPIWSLNETFEKRVKFRLNLQKTFLTTYWVLLIFYLIASIIWVILAPHTTRALLEVSFLGIALSVLNGICLGFDIKTKRTTTFFLMQEAQNDPSCIQNTLYNSLLNKNIPPSKTTFPVASLAFLNAFVMIAAAERMNLMPFILIGFLLIFFGIYIMFWVDKWNENIKSKRDL